MSDDTGRTWPFFAPSERASVDQALDLAGVGAGTHVIDLGCGDGQVLLVAAERGARATGIEADPELVEEARANLTAAGVEATLLCADLFDPDLDLAADVWFTYLAPATLQRLVPRLERFGRGPLVTVDFAVPGRVPTKVAGAARRYSLPGRRRAVGELGWPAAGTLVTAVPDHLSLTCLDVVHPGGRVTARAAGGLRDAVSVYAGADHLDAPAALAVDLRWEPAPEGTILTGTLQVRGLDPQPTFVVYTDDDHGTWDLTTDEVASLRRALRRTTPPATLAELLDAR